MTRVERLLTTREIADVLAVHPKQIYRLMKRGLPAARVGDEWRFDRAAVLQWARASAAEPGEAEPAPAVPPLVAANGDLVIERLLAALASQRAPLLGFVLADHTGGLSLLHERRVLFAGAHEEQLSDGHGLAPRFAHLHLVRREIGIAARSGARLRDLSGLAGKRLAARPASAGVRRALDAELEQRGIEHAAVYRRATELRCHRDVVLAVARGEADFGLTTEAWAAAAGLSFRAVKAESYGLSVALDQLGDPRVRALCEVAQAGTLRKTLRGHGYGVARTGMLQIG